jgi:hypothetical protein
MFSSSFDTYATVVMRLYGAVMSAARPPGNAVSSRITRRLVTPHSAMPALSLA